MTHALPALDVLVVDDNEMMQALLNRVLSAAGAHVRLVVSAEAALDALRERRAGLLLVDNALPGMSGLELTRLLRADAAHAAMRIVMLSGKSDPEHLSAVRQAGADEVLVKPVSPRVLLERLDFIMRSAAVTAPAA